MQHVISSKRPSFSVIINSSNVDRFSKSFHRLIQKIAVNQPLKFSQQLKRVTIGLLSCEILKFKIEVKVAKPVTTKNVQSETQSQKSTR